MAKQDKGPATRSMAYEAMLPMWAKIDTLLGGTETMRQAGELYLPKHEEESDDAYNERLGRAVLLNMVSMTLDGWVGKPFSDPIEVGDDVPQQLKDLLDNVDLQGNSLDVFARNWFKDGVAKGFSHVLVDFPRAKPREDGAPRTLADDAKDNLRPYLCHVKPENCIFAEAEIYDGVERCIHVRIEETHVTRVGWEETVTNRMRVIEPGLVVIYEERRDPKNPKRTIWVEIERYTYSLDYIPLVTFYGDRQGFMLSKPPLTDLADLNIAHWQSRSDQTAVLTVARFPILAVSGAMSDDKLRVGPNQWLSCPDAAGRFYYVEHTGRAINAGRTDLLDLEETMAEYGAVFLKKRPGGASATARALDSAEVTSPLQDMALRFQSSLNAAFKMMADWIKQPTGGTFKVNIDFGLEQGDLPHLQALQEARAARDISNVRYLKELHRFGVLGDDFVASENDKELANDLSKDLAKLEAEAKIEAANAPAPAGPAAVVNVRGGKKKAKPPAKK